MEFEKGRTRGTSGEYLTPLLRAPMFRCLQPATLIRDVAALAAVFIVELTSGAEWWRGI